MTNKEKKKIKKLISITVTLIVLIAAGISWVALKITTPPSLEKVISGITIDTSEISMEVSMVNDESDINFVFIVSEDNNYIKTVKSENDVIDTTILYKKDNSYILSNNDVNVELEESDALNMFETIKNEVIDLNDYLDINYDTIRYYKYEETKVSYSNYRNNIFYDNVIVFENDNLYEITQVFTKDNMINTINIKIVNDFNIVLPN